MLFNKINFYKYLLIIPIIALIIARFYLAFEVKTSYYDETVRMNLMNEILNNYNISFRSYRNFLQNVFHFPVMFVLTDSGYSIGTYFYPASLFAKIFGLTVLKMRFFSVFITVITILIIGFSLSFKCWGGKKRLSYLFVLISLAIPWNFVQGMMIWSNTFVPFYFSIGFCAFSYLFSIEGSKNKRKIFIDTAKFFLPVGLLLSAYSYVSSAPVILLCFIIFYSLLIYKNKISYRYLFITMLFSIPIGINYLMAYSSDLVKNRTSVLLTLNAPVSYYDRIALLVNNLWQMFSPNFLFFYGDSNLRHSTGFYGMIGFGFIIPLVIGFVMLIKASLFKRFTGQFILLFISIVGIFSSCFMAAMTNEGIPHGLRSMMAWVFYSIFIAVGANYLFTIMKKSKKIYVLSCISVLLFTIGTITFIKDALIDYPKRSVSYFR